MAEFMNVLAPQRRKARNFRKLNDPFKCYNDDEFYKRFCFSKESVNQVAALLNIKEAETARNRAISAKLQLLVALRYYASGSFQQVISDTVSISQPSASRIVTRISTALCAKMDDIIKFTNDEIVKQQFYLLGGFPGVVGCVDGTHIRIMAPHDNEYQFVNRKGYHSINMLAVCDANRKFTHVVIKWPGSVHDSWMLKQSSVWEEFEERRREGIILGDSAFPCREWLMTPFLLPNTRNETLYNTAHKKTRVLIENAFGCFKRRFPLMHQENRRSLPHVCLDIGACAVLHNLAINFNQPDDFLEVINPLLQPDIEPFNNNVDNGLLFRNHIVNTFFRGV